MKTKLKQSGLTHEITSYLTGLTSEVPNGRRKGLTLTEVLTTIVIIVILTVVALPAINAFFDSMSSSGSAEVMINAALSNARAMAISRQRYVGVRFQKIYNQRGPLFADQYMIFVINDTTIGANAFRAVNGMKPLKLPDNIGLMDLYLVLQRNKVNPVNPKTQEVIQSDDQINDEVEFTDTSTFSVVFSPSGKMVIHGLYVKNDNDVFNTSPNVSNGIGMFVQDDYFTGNSMGNPDLGLGPEPSRRYFIIYDTKEFRRAFEQEIPYSGYLQALALKPIYINPYTGTIISSD